MLRVLLCGLVLALAFAGVFAQELSVAPFRGDAAGALSLTFDDGSQNQVDMAVPLLNEFGVKATFFLVTGVMRDKPGDPLPKGANRSGNGGASWEEWRAVAKMGHEIANHSLTHRQLPKITDPAVLDAEVNGSYDLIKQKIGKAPLTFCYPGNGGNDAVRAVVLQRHCLARERCVGYGTRTTGFDLAMANGYADRAMAEHDWLVGMIHGIEEGYSPVDRETLRGHLQYLTAHKDTLWVDTFANIGRYRLEQAQATLTVNKRKTATAYFSLSIGKTRLLKVGKPREQIITFTLTTPLDAKRYNVPLTVVIPTPTQARHVRCSRPFTVRPDRILVDVVPGKKAVTVKWR